MKGGVGGWGVRGGHVNVQVCLEPAFGKEDCLLG